MEYKDGVFIIVREDGCPVYNKGEEFVILNSTLTVDFEKPVCLILVDQIQEALREKPGKQRLTQHGLKRSRFECGGCGEENKIIFEYKQEKAFSTLQMNLLRLAEKKEKKRHVEMLVDVLSEMKVFEHLDERDLRDLAALLKIKKFLPHKVLIKEGERGRYIYITLSGTVRVLKGEKKEVVNEMTTGEIFGEMSMLSSEPAAASVHTLSVAEFATLNTKDLKFILAKYPVLQLFFYRLLVNRAQVTLLRSGKISSGMSGELLDINSVELFQLINAGGKSGRVDLNFPEGRGSVLFYDGEIIEAEFMGILDKEAVYAILAKTEGSFTYSTGIDDMDKELPVIGGFMGLLMEGLRRIDELEEAGG